ncbi:MULTISPECIES: FAD-dependent monooxygenase [unclassified Janthinobacterium]|uniref:FAD-dependent monooxygenase n=1 Tax=unclassified Janthinobacterium TaxID=2610881 RepID=UPI00160EF17D|nr:MULTISPECIES: FAD-dependent monooxygenase [unclassified Janthinobacterium]MBB5609333.1 2-polyprenyl-6-methoxyphenol hydroxylase-like FAD-dependent oxidoreductase [Janthinobacterium sp. S3T4]MBB5614506.1 2-polyprenyl-6-methoxyphenol hydroxylase-like FAD-dependent oxidoreductase [Janthinobacterium sp. S3M3]
MGTFNGKKVLISGASFAGLSCAYWMRQLGYEVTIVETAPRLRTGGTAVNIGGNTIEIVRRMGIFEQIRANRLQLRQFDFKNADDQTERSMVLRVDGEPAPEDDYEIERDVLMHILLDAVRDDCEILFDDRIVALHESELVDVSFKQGRRAAYDLVLGCDGMHSRVRKLCFGAEAQHMQFLQQYFSISIVDKLLIERDTAQMFNLPGKMVMLNAYKNKTDIIFGFVSDHEIAYDYRDEAQQRGIIAGEFEGAGWRTAEMLREMDGASNFYFDKLCQIRMPSWSSGRVVLVGDAAYCASPASGKGGSLAIDGAAALADAMRSAAGDYALAFHRYEENFRPYIDEVQTDAVRVGLEMLIPRTEEAIRVRNAKTDAGF